LIDKIVADLTAFQYKNKPLFRVAEPGSGLIDDTKHFKETPHAQVRFGAKNSDGEEPHLGTKDVVIKIMLRDHSGGMDGVTQQSADSPRGYYAQIAEYLNDNYEYRAGDVYGAAFYLESIDELTPEGDGLYSFEARYKALLG